ncbi:GNAT family protein [Micromonospora sp. M12]
MGGDRAAVPSRGERMADRRDRPAADHGRGQRGVGGQLRSVVHRRGGGRGVGRLRVAAGLAWPGYATRAVRLLAGWAFGPAGIARLSAGTVPDNIASHRVLERVGFQREALQRGRLPGLAGARLDDLTFALLPSDLR